MVVLLLIGTRSRVTRTLTSGNVGRCGHGGGSSDQPALCVRPCQRSPIAARCSGRGGPATVPFSDSWALAIMASHVFFTITCHLLISSHRLTIRARARACTLTSTHMCKYRAILLCVLQERGGRRTQIVALGVSPRSLSVWLTSVSVRAGKAPRSRSSYLTPAGTTA